MRTIIQFLNHFSFWGVFFLLSLMFGYNVSVATVLQEALHGGQFVNIYCAYMLISVIIFIISFILLMIIERKLGIKGLCFISFYAEDTIRMPYNGFGRRWLIPLKEKDIGFKLFLFYNSQFFKHLIKTILWWGLVALGFWSFMTVDNEIASSIRLLSTEDKLTNTAIIISIIVVLNIVSFIISKISRKRERYNDAIMEIDQRESKKNIPVGCAACGGPYPSCKSSCNLYDD